MDLSLPDIAARDFVQQLEALPHWDQTPIILHTAKDPVPADTMFLRRHCRVIVVKDPRSSALGEAASLWLHRNVATQGVETGNLERLESTLSRKRVLIVDDDVRNIFALNSLLERYRMNIATAETGRAAIEIVQNGPPFDIVLMDVMMPEMDGYETTRAIRALGTSGNLPIIAVTAKAMRGDREKCFEAGASDYITKPVDSASLLSRLSAWLSPNTVTGVRRDP